MLDLNIDAICVHSFSDESSDRPRLPTAMVKLTEDGAGPQREDSGTSISSVINADEAPPSTRGDNGSSSTRSFSQPEWATRVENSVRSAELVTRQLFPVNGGVKNYEFGSIYSSATSLLRPQLLKLTPPDDQLIVFEDQNPPPPRPQVRKSRRGPKPRSSEYRGVTFNRRTGRWESHIWDCGKQVYLGGFDTAHAAARAYDRAAVKFRGVDADINFSISDYEDDLKQTKDLTKEEFVLILRRQSTGICRGSSKYRGVTLHQCGRWEARMDQFLVKAYDKAAIECNGEEAVLNFDPSTCEGEVSLINNNQDTYHNLDLNLWISPPSGDQKGNDNVRSLHLHDAAYGLPSGKRTKVESLVSAPMAGETPHALTMGSIHLPTWPGIYYGLAPNNEERAFKKTEAEAVPSPRFSKWAWQMNSHDTVNPMPPFSMAASSGFCSNTTPAFSGSLLSLNTQNKKLYLSSSPNETSFYSSHKY